MTREIEPGDLEEMWKLYKEDGVSIETLAQEYAYSKKLVYKEFARKGEVFHTGRRSRLEEMDSTEVEQLVWEYREWVPVKVIMQKHGIESESVLYKMLETVGVPPRMHEREYLQVKQMNLDEAISMYTKGYPIWQICQDCQVDSAKLYKELHRRGIRVGRKRGGAWGVE